MVILMRLLGAFLLTAVTMVAATDSAEARRRFSIGSSGSSASSVAHTATKSRVIVVPRVTKKTDGEDMAGEAGVTGIALVYNLPNTPSFSIGSGYFDVGYHEDGAGYVFYNKAQSVPISPEQRAGLKEVLGFDPIEVFEAEHAVPGKTPLQPLALTGAAEVEDGGFGFWPIAMLISALISVVGVVMTIRRKQAAAA